MQLYRNYTKTKYDENEIDLDSRLKSTIVNIIKIMLNFPLGI